MRFRYLISGALSAMCIAGHSVADVVPWKTVRGWDVSFYPSIEGCLAYVVYDMGTSFFIGLDTAGDEVLLDVTLMDDRWKSIEDGKEYVIHAKFGDESRWTMYMDGKDYGGTPGLNAKVAMGPDKADLFADEFQRETRMMWEYEGTQLGQYTLSGSRAAFQEVLACQKSYMEATQSSDPFDNKSKSSDPFAN